MRKKKKEYVNWIKDELKLHKIRVHKWGKFSEHETYYAYFDSRRVYIPVPKCDFSFLVALHEIGHLVVGNDFYGHIAEYNAEEWALQTAKTKYGIISEEYEESGKNYVYEQLIEDIAYRFFNYSNLNLKIKRWINIPKKYIINDAEKLKI